MYGNTHYRNGGARGGADQFKWDSVKDDKHRENYLGHSLNAPVGRWQRGKDLQWWSKAKKSQKSRVDDERKKVKEEEAQLLAEEMGMVPKRVRYESALDELDQKHLKDVFKRGEVDHDDGGGVASERVAGIGAEPLKKHDFVPIGRRRNVPAGHSEGDGSSSGSGSGSESDAEEGGTDLFHEHGDTTAGVAGADGAAKREKKRKKKSKKKQKKEKKAAKKKKKKDRKRKRKEAAKEKRDRENAGGESPGAKLRRLRAMIHSEERKVSQLAYNARKAEKVKGKIDRR